MEKINKELQKTMEAYILPKYNNFDKGHSIDHVNDVIYRSLKLANDYNLDYNMCYVIACYHDIGLEINREDHHIYSAIAVRNDKKDLAKWFTNKEIEIIANACEQHRASRNKKPDTIYGCVVSDADRSDSIETMIKRSYSYHLENDEDKSIESVYKNVYNHLKEKYGNNGYVTYYLEKSKEFSKDIVNILENKKLFDNKFNAVLEEL